MDIKISFYIENIRNNFIIIFFFYFHLKCKFYFIKRNNSRVRSNRNLWITFSSSSFARLVSLVAGCVLVFRNSYIKDEPYNNRFIILVILFVLSIFLLIMRPNIISLLLGGDGLGVTSYLLVVFYQRRKSYNAGILTALTNRLGDVGILISIGMILISNN